MQVRGVLERARAIGREAVGVYVDIIAGERVDLTVLDTRDRQLTVYFDIRLLLLPSGKT